MLKVIGMKLEKIFDFDRYLFIEKGLREGISYIAKRYSDLNDKYMKNYDPKTRQNIYRDMNKLYGWTMSSYLPYGGFKWLKKIDNFSVNSISKNIPIGYILEVDLEYHDELHVLHNDNSLKTCNSL